MALWASWCSDIKDLLLDASTRAEKLADIVGSANSRLDADVNATTEDNYIFNYLDAWNGYDGRDGTRLLISQQRAAVIEALGIIKETTSDFNFMTIDMRNVAREHCDATTDGIHYNMDMVFGQLFSNALRIMINGCVDGCDWVHTVDY